MAAIDYRRKMLILNEKDRGYGIDSEKKPMGFVKIETRGGKGVLTILAQNLRDLKEEGLVYKGFAAAADGRPIFINTGAIPVDSTGKGESKWEFDPSNVAGTGYSLEKFHLFGITVYSPEYDQHNSVCLTAGNVDELPRDWKEALIGRSQEGTDATLEEKVVSEQVADADEIAHQDLKTEYKEMFRLEAYIWEMLRPYPEIQPFEQPMPESYWWRINSYDYIFGVMKDGDHGIKYYMYGIPGSHQTQAQIQMKSYGFCRWQPRRGGGHGPNNSGYWIAFVDAKTGKLANPK